MLRAVLVGLLSVSAVACKSGGDPPKSQPSAAAGKVVEVSGTVTVRHKDVAQPLVRGAVVEGDDVIETGADGNTIIELSHNLVRWELGPNKTSKVSESIAWGLAKKSGDVAAVQQDTAATGRPAERSAADTSVNAPAERERAKDVAPAPGSPRPQAATPPAAEAQHVASAEGKAPPKPNRESQSDDVLDANSGGGAPAKTQTGGGAPEQATAGADKGSRTMSAADADKAATDVVLAHEKTLKACLTKDAQAVSVTIKVAANGTASAIVTAKAAVPAAVQKCVKQAVANMKFAAAATTVSLEISR